MEVSTSPEAIPGFPFAGDERGRAKNISPAAEAKESVEKPKAVEETKGDVENRTDKMMVDIVRPAPAPSVILTSSGDDTKDEALV
jgi:hypothetical protein